MNSSYGTLGILNVGAGDTKLTFDKDKPADRERAAKIVADMLKRGYAILVQVGEKDGEPLYQRAKGFDPETCEYIVAGLPDETIDIGAADAPAEDAPQPRRRRGRPPMSTTRIAAEATRAVSVGRTAGG